MNELYIGQSNVEFDYYFDDNNIFDISGNFSTSLSGDELCADTFTANVRYLYDEDAEEEMPDLRTVQYGEKIWYYKDKKLVCQFYITQVKRISRDNYTIYGTSGIGLLDNTNYYGAVLNGESFSGVARSILLSDGLTSPEDFMSYFETNGYASYSGTNSSVWLGASYSTRIRIAIDYVGLLESLNRSSKLTVRVPIFGTTPYEGMTVLDVGATYGVYGECTRESTNVPFSGVLSLYATYSSYSFDPSFTNQEILQYTTKFLGTVEPETLMFFDFNTQYLVNDHLSDSDYYNYYGYTKVGYKTKRGDNRINDVINKTSGPDYGFILATSWFSEFYAPTLTYTDTMYHCGILNGDVDVETRSVDMTYLCGGFSKNSSSGSGSNLVDAVLRTCYVEVYAPVFNASATLRSDLPKPSTYALFLPTIRQLNGTISIARYNFTGTFNPTLVISGTNTFYNPANSAFSPGEILSSSDDYNENDVEIYNTFDIDDELANTLVYGYIPPSSKREALYQLMFAVGASITKSTDGKVLLHFPYDKEKNGDIPEERIYMEGSIEYPEAVQAISLTEHLYFDKPSNSSVVVYDNTGSEAVSNKLVLFNQAPVVLDSIVATGTIAIDKKCVNAAVVSGRGTITARPYVHAQSVITREVSSDHIGKKISVTNATMVTLVNSENVMNRIYSYYDNATIAKLGIILDKEICGGYYSFVDPFGEEAEGFMIKEDIRSSFIAKANVDIAMNYSPTKGGNNYSTGIILTGSGTWDVPEEVFSKPVKSIRVIMIGGGNGGQSGLAGEDGTQITSFSSFGVTPAAANGGDAGANGEGGTIYEKVITFTNETSASFQYSCGAGGQGGGVCTSTETHNDGSAGGDTTFGNYSSAQGVRNDEGVQNFFTGQVLGAKPTTNYGVRGGDGGKVTRSNNVTSFYTGGNVIDPVANLQYLDGEYLGGSTADSVKWWGTINSAGIQTYTYYTAGGCGSGAAAGQKGRRGTSPEYRGQDETNMYLMFYAGDGADGADAITTIPVPGGSSGGGLSAAGSYGWGGFGGSGGGGGGHSGCGGQSPGGDLKFIPGLPGHGGKGGAGGNGADGCIIIYY